MTSNYVNGIGSFDGIYYASRYGRDLENWALFEFRAEIHPIETHGVSPDDPVLLEALDILQLQVPGPDKERSGFSWVISLKDLILGKKSG